MDDKQDDLHKINVILSCLHPIVKSGNMENFIYLIKTIDAVKEKNLLRTHLSSKNIELISLICKYNRKKHLSYLLKETHILHYLTNENKNIEMKFNEDAFYYAMSSNNFDTLEMLYDYWSGDLHFLGHKKEYDKFDVEKLKDLKSLLTCAFNRYQRYLEIKGKIILQNISNIESLMAFNVFQIELYSNLNELKDNLIMSENEEEDIIRIQETYAIKSMILSVFDIYEKHSEQSLFENSVLTMIVTFVDSSSDTSSLIHESRLFKMYEAFFRKLDYNVCLLILDNLHLLKLRLSMLKNTYQELESKLYYFIYNINNKWNLYLPKRKRYDFITVLGPFKGRLCCFLRNSKENEYDYYSIYLERRDFKKAIKCFKNELKNTNIEENIRRSQIKLPNEDNNTLTLLPHLRDDYSLKKISLHISQLYSIDLKYKKKYAFLLIERTLQVVGEFLKSTDETLHLQESTEALVKAEISVEVVSDLKVLRNLLCHAKNGELLKRIEVEVNNPNIFELILKELLYVKKKIDDVIKVHKPVVERDLIQNSLRVLHKRREEMPENVSNIHYNILNTINQFPIDFIRQDIEKNYYENNWAPQGFSKSLMKEIIVHAEHSAKLISKKNKAINTINNNVTLKLPFYRERIEESLKIILTHIEEWRQIVIALKEEISSIHLLDYPNEEDANRIKSYTNKVVLSGTSLSQTVEVNELFANVERHWKFIENLLQFIIQKTHIFNDTIEELKWSMFTYKIKHISKHNYKTHDMEKNVIEFLDIMEAKISNMKFGKKYASFRDTNDNIANSEKSPKFTGIKEITYKLMSPNILTKEEKQKLIGTIENKKPTNDVKKCNAIEIMISKIETDSAIPRKEYRKFIELIKLDSKSQKTLLNLVMGHKRNPLLPQCLSNRIILLKELMTEQSANQLVLRYKSDKTFRVLLEVLLFDVFIVMECNKNKTYIQKTSKLLTEINLRNILTHGSPLLEVVGNILDSDDLPTELLTKALDFIEDERAIDALCALNEIDFDFTQIDNVTQNSNQLLKEFRTSSRWKDYLKLLPEYKQKIYIKHKKVVEIDDNSVELLKAVKKRDAALVQNCIDKGGNVNFLDVHKKSVIHYAAMNGSVNVLDVLLKNKADVNIANEENKLTALHYSAMNNFLDSVKYLLQNGANCFALDYKGRTPVYWAGQRNHVNVCRILVKAMKK